MKSTKIDQLRTIAADESLSTGLRDAAKQQLNELGVQINAHVEELQLEPEQAQPEQVQPPKDETLPPSKDFIRYRLTPLWEKLPGESRPSLERWVRSDECKAIVQRHDAAATREAEAAGMRWAHLLDSEPSEVAAAIRWHSWNWEHMSFSGMLRHCDAREYELLGQEQACD